MILSGQKVHIIIDNTDTCVVMDYADMHDKGYMDTKKLKLFSIVN